MTEVVILGGCGKRDYVILGALHHLISQDLLSNVTSIVTCSTTSNIAILLAAGYSPIDISLFPEDYILQDKLLAVFGKVPSLQDLKNRCNLDLFFSVFNKTKSSIDYISTLEHPDMSCIEAVTLATNSVTKNATICDSFLCDPYPIPLITILPMLWKSLPIMGICIVDELCNDLPLLNGISLLTNMPRNELIKRGMREAEHLYEKIEHILIKADLDENRVVLFVRGKTEIEKILAGDEKNGNSSCNNENERKHAPEVMSERIVEREYDKTTNYTSEQNTTK